MEKTIHHGRNVRCFREMQNIKQEGLAAALGADWNQRKISLLEQKDVIDDDLLEQVANALHIPSQVIKNFETESALNFFSNTFNDNATLNSNGYNNNIAFNPIEKILEIFREKEVLYERMLKEKDEMIARLEKLFNRA